MVTDEQLIQRIRSELDRELAWILPHDGFLDDLWQRADVSSGKRASARPHHTAARLRPRNAAAVIATLVSVAVTIAIVAAAIVGLREDGQRSTTHPAQIPAAGPQLFSILGVLRRPQTAADRAAATELADQPAAQRARIEAKLLSTERRLAARGNRTAAARLQRELTRLRAQEPPARAPDPQVRLAAVTPWGEQVILVPYRSGRTEELCMDSRNGSAGCGMTAGAIEAGRAWSLEGAAREFAGGSTGVRLFIVVPDGVAKVAFVLSRDSGVPGGSVYRHSASVIAPVHNKVAFAQVNRQCCDGFLVTRWYAPDSRLIKVSGNPAISNRVAGPRPAPETPLSRAAERDPSTPNAVHIVPSSGGPKAAFKIQWRVLLSDADYKISATGPNGAGCRGASDLGGVTGGGVNDVRGQLYGVPISPSGNLGKSWDRWCLGTYRVSVTLYDLGLAGGLKHPDRPFGAATFTVRP